MKNAKNIKEAELQQLLEEKTALENTQGKAVELRTRQSNRRLFGRAYNAVARPNYELPSIASEIKAKSELIAAKQKEIDDLDSHTAGKLQRCALVKPMIQHVGDMDQEKLKDICKTLSTSKSRSMPGKPASSEGRVNAVIQMTTVVLESKPTSAETTEILEAARTKCERAKQKQQHYKEKGIKHYLWRMFYWVADTFFSPEVKYVLDLALSTKVSDKLIPLKVMAADSESAEADDPLAMRHYRSPIAGNQPAAQNRNNEARGPETNNKAAAVAVEVTRAVRTS